MAIEQKLSLGSESTITSIASGSNSKCILDENCETIANVSDVALKVRKPYTISKQREKWTEEEHQKFIEALKLYGRAWRQIEEYIGTKTAVQIRSHAQKFFSKVMKEGACSVEAPTEPIEIPPPRPKRKPLHPYPRKLVEAPNKAKQCPSLVENGTSTNMKTLERDAHSPMSVLSPEGSHISTSHAKAQGSGYVSRTSSGSNLSHVVENSTLVKDNSTRGKEKENEENISLTLNSSGLSPDHSTLMSAGMILKDIESNKDVVNTENRIKFVGGGAPLKSIKLFGRTVAVANISEYSDGMNNLIVHIATGDHIMSCDSHIDSITSVHKVSETHVPITELASKINNQLVSGGILMGKRPCKKEGSKGFSCTGSNSNSFNEVNADTNLDSVDSKNEYNQQSSVNLNNSKKGFYPYKRCISDREAVNTADDRGSQRIRVYL